VSRRVRVVSLAAALLASSAIAEAKKPPPLCPEARFVVDTIVGVSAGTAQLLVVAGGQVSLVGECAAAKVVRKATPRGTRLTAVWPNAACHDLRGRTKLVATIAPGCATLAGTVTARKAHFKHPVAGKVSACADGVLDTGRGEACDGPAGCPPGESCNEVCACVPGTGATTTTTVPAITTRCCQAVGACIDADAADAQALCDAFSATLAPAGQVCDAANAAMSPSGPQCGALKTHGARCCECAQQSPPFPHPQSCFETSTGTCGSICTRHDGATCDAVSETCQP
jgi:hypothetical protein